MRVNGSSQFPHAFHLPRFVAAQRLFVVLAISTAIVGCAGAERFLPPGIVKYEDLEKGQPVKPEMAEIIAAEDAKEPQKFPRLSEQPNQRPRVIPLAKRENREARLKERGAQLKEAVAADKTAADGERGLTLEEELAILEQEIAEDAKAAAKERRETLTAPAPIKE